MDKKKKPKKKKRRSGWGFKVLGHRSHTHGETKRFDDQLKDHAKWLQEKYCI